MDAARRDMLVSAARRAARTHVLPRFRELRPQDIAQKTSAVDLVTIADTEAEKLFTQAVAMAWPEAVVIGEEAVAADPGLLERIRSASTVVIVDPIDGTWNYAKGLAVFGMIVAVAQQGQVRWGMLYDPVLEDWVEAGLDGICQMVRPNRRERLGVSAQTQRQHLNGFLPMKLFDKALQERLAISALGFGRVGNLRCSCHEYRLLAQGHAEFVLSGPTPNPWDHAAGILAVRQAGGVARFLDGTPYDLTRPKGAVLSACSEEAWQMLAQEFHYLA